MRKMYVCISVFFILGIFCLWFAFVNALFPTRINKLLNITGINAHGYPGWILYHYYWLDLLGYTDGEELIIFPVSCIESIKSYEWKEETIQIADPSMRRSRPYSDIKMELWDEVYDSYTTFEDDTGKYTIMLSQKHCAIYRHHHNHYN